MSDARSSEITVLGLTVEFEGRTDDAIAELPPGATVAALAHALTLHFTRLPPVVDLTVQRTGETLPADAVAMDRDLRAGDVLLAYPSGRAPFRMASSAAASRPPADGFEIALRGRRAAAAPEVQLRSVALRSARARRPAPAGPAVARLAGAGTTTDIPAGAFTASGDGWCDLELPALAAWPHAFELRAEPGALHVRVADEAASLSVDGRVTGTDWTVVPDGGVLRAGSEKLVAHVPRPAHPRAQTDRLVIGDQLAARPRLDLGVGGFVPVHRPPRRISGWRPTKVELPDTPRPTQRIRIPLVASLVPLIGGVVMWLIFDSAMMLVFSALSPLMAAGTYFSDQRTRKQSGEQSKERFEARLTEAHGRMAAALDLEVRERREAAPHLTELLGRAESLSPRLWERRPWDPDFLTLRLGLGDLAAATQVEVRPSPDVDPDPRIPQLASAARTLKSVPSTVALGTAPVIGLAGHRTVSSDIARSLVLQAATLHSPLELGVAAALAPGGEEGWDWLKWLPHTQTAAGLIDQAPLGTGRRAIEVLRAIRDRTVKQLAVQRSALHRDDHGDGPALLLLIDEALQLDRSLVAEILGNARALRHAVIWIGTDPRSLPGECQTLVDCASSGVGTVVTMQEPPSESRVQLEGATIAQAVHTVRALAPTRDVTVAAGSAAVPARIKLLDQLGMPEPSAAQIAERWQRRGDGGIGAAIGMAAGEPLTIDLRADGPHGLIAGTTGAGKSELLRTIVASLAIAHPPSRLTFLLIDYKGGAAFAPCAGLPHVLDVVSDLDAELGERALVSLDAEMKHREHLLASARADNLIDLERRAPALAPPNLVIMVDEFAKLRDEIPDFIDGVVDVAQRGRTLGIHMLLAAQSLRSAFTPAVRANTNLRIALRVTSDAESQDVIEAADAGRIPSGESMRGRAYARIGHERLIEFQTAHVSGRHAPPGDAVVAVRSFPFDDLPVASVRREVRTEGPPRADETDLAMVARAAAEARELIGLEPARPAWTPPLPDLLPRTAIQRHTDASVGRVAVGLVDEPQRQRQMPLVLDLDRGHVAIFGAGGTGKTVALQTVVAGLTWDASPADLQIYAIDADAGALSIIEPLPHVSTVVPATDGERVERILDRLEAEVRQRAALHAEIGAGSLTDYLASGPARPLPRIVLLIDGFGEFSALHDTARADSLFDRLVTLMGSGRSVGVHLVVTADRRGAVRSAVAVNFPQRLLLRQAATDDLVAFGVPVKLAERVTLPEGRAFTEDQLLAQLAEPATAEGATDPADGFRRLAAHLEAAWPGLRAPTIDSLPDRVDRAVLAGVRSRLEALPIGVGGADTAPVTVDLGERHFLVSGGYRTGRTAALDAIADALETAGGFEFVHLLAPRRSALLDRTMWSSAARGADACAEAARSLAAAVGDLPDHDGVRGVLMIDDGGELQDPQTMMALERIVRLGRDRGVRVVAAMETSTARMLGNLWARELRRDGSGLLLCPDLMSDGDLLGVSLPRRSNVADAPGRGYLVGRGRASLVQVAL